MQPNEHNMQVLEWILNEYILHMYGITDRSNIVVHLNQNDYHPIKHDSVMDD